jgi:hypothetical protein
LVLDSSFHNAIEIYNKYYKPFERMTSLTISKTDERN